MKAVEIEDAISALAERPFDADEFPFPSCRRLPRVMHSTGAASRRRFGEVPVEELSRARAITPLEPVTFISSRPSWGWAFPCFSSRTSSGKLSATNITVTVTSPTVTPSHQ
jgi:hypothetical protein